jgi:hypothetical protein
MTPERYAAWRAPSCNDEGLRLARRLLMPQEHIPRAKEAAMDSLYYKVIGFILMVPWTLLGLTVAGYLRSRLARRGH